MAGDIYQSVGHHPKASRPIWGLYMIYKRLGALSHELYIDRRKRKVVHHSQLKPYLGLKQPPGYYCVVTEVNRDISQPQVSVQSRGQFSCADRGILLYL